MSQTVQTVSEIIARHAHLEGPLLPMLHDIQAELGHIPETAVPELAAALNIGRAEVHGVISFYHDFRKTPAGKHVVKVCRAEACQAVGANALSDRALALLGGDWHGKTAGGVTIEPVYCLGLCACGPAVMVDGQLEGRVDTARFDEILSEVGA